MNKKAPIFVIRTVLLLILSTFFFFPGAAFSDSAQIAIVPFKINSKEDLSYLKEGMIEMFAGHLSGKEGMEVISQKKTETVYQNYNPPYNKETIREIGKKLNATHVLSGSLTAVGNSFSIDTQLVPTSSKSKPASFSKHGSSMDDLIPNVHGIAEEIAVVLQGSEKKQKKKQSHFRNEKLDDPEALYWRSKNIDLEAKGIAIGDVDGDKKMETVLISSGEVFILRFKDDDFQIIASFDEKTGHNLIAVDIMDTDKDHHAEIFVTSEGKATNSLNSFVMEWNGENFVKITEKENWYFRVIRHPQKGPKLYGQKRGISKIYYPGIYELSFSNGEYLPSQKLNTPENVTIFGFSIGDISGNGTDMIVALDHRDRMIASSLEGKVIWQTKNKYGGSENYMEIESSEQREYTERLFLPQRLFITDLSNDGKNEVFLVDNSSTSGRLFARVRNYKSARLKSFKWDGAGLANSGQTNQIPWYIPDYGLGDYNNDGKPDFAACIVNQRKSMTRKGSSAVISYNIETLTGNY